MFQSRNFTASQTFLLLFITFHYATQLPAPQNISIDSVNMKHLLKWSPVQDDCAPVNYSVKFQGEYETYMLNGSWVDAHDCQETVKTECDMTHDLASDSDYSIGVQAECRGQRSWAQLPTTFNRRDTLLVAPNMSVIVTENLIQVGFTELLPDTTIHLRVWREGDEQSAFSQTIKSRPYHFSYHTRQEGGRHCLKAEALLEAINKSSSIRTHCVIVPRCQPCWIKPVTVSVSLVIIVGVVLALAWSVPHCGPRLRRALCHREPLPNSLLKGWPVTTSSFSLDLPLEFTHSLSLLHPCEPTERTTVTNTTCADVTMTTLRTQESQNVEHDSIYHTQTAFERIQRCT